MNRNEYQISRMIKNILNDYTLGRMIRKHGVSVMRVEDERSGPDAWSACDSVMGYDYGHCGNWANAKTPIVAAKLVLNLKETT